MKHAEATHLNRQHHPTPMESLASVMAGGFPFSSPTPATLVVPGMPPGRAQILDENGLLMTPRLFLGPSLPMEAQQRGRQQLAPLWT